MSSLIFVVEFSLMISLDGLDVDFESESRVLGQLDVVLQLFHLSLQFEEFLQIENRALFVHFHIQPVPAASWPSPVRERSCQHRLWS